MTLDKESDIRNATDRIRQQLNDSFKKQDELNEEIKLLKVCLLNLYCFKL